MKWIPISAHIREAWGKKLLLPGQLVPDDYEAVCGCDLLIAYLVEPNSQGVLVELGWASANRKPILLIMRDGQKYSPVIEGLNLLTDVKVMTVSGESPDELVPLLEGYVAAYEQVA